MCGVSGVYSTDQAAAPLVFQLQQMLQHRGQESAGLAVTDGNVMWGTGGDGWVTAVISESILAMLGEGRIGIGHNRYPTAGQRSRKLSAAEGQRLIQPLDREGLFLAHNGNLVRVGDKTDFSQTSDTGVLADQLALEIKNGLSLSAALKLVLPTVVGAYSMVLMDREHLIGVRDPYGFRPLCLGRIPNRAWVLASEDSAFDSVEANFVREIEPGEMIVIGESGPRSVQIIPKAKSRLCVFEEIYFARPDTTLGGTEIHGIRVRMGELLAEQAPVKADLVIGVPDSGTPAAEGYAKCSGIPYGQGLVRNRYVGRTFIGPNPREAVSRKLRPLKKSIYGKCLVVVDDSIIRGNTTRAIVQMLREAGAVEIHLRISSPPYISPCFYGLDTPDPTELIATKYGDSDGIAEQLGADSLEYLDLENLLAAIEATADDRCLACLTGGYPTETPISFVRK